MSELLATPDAGRAFYSFRVQDQLYGIDLLDVREVSTQVECAAVPMAPSLVRGLANLRSRIYLVLDVGTAVQGEPSRLTPDSRLVILQARTAENLALLVDSGGDIVRAAPGQLEAAGPTDADAVPGRPGSPVTALCKLESELMMVIDPARIVTALENVLR